VYVAGSPATTPSQCGPDSVYCPAGSTLPVNVTPGYYTDGPSGMRVSSLVCDLGKYCPGDGREYDCGFGHFGNSTGLMDSNCSGTCGDGEHACGAPPSCGWPLRLGQVWHVYVKMFVSGTDLLAHWRTVSR
jgi:hypothetical protein